MTGALNVHSDTEIYLDCDAVLQGTDNVDDYLPRRKSRFEGVERECYSSLLNLGELDKDGDYNCKNVVIRGGGTVSGGGERLCWATIESEKERLKKYLDSNADYVKTCENENTVPGRVRGRLINMSNCQNVVMSGITMQYGPAWNVHMIYSKDITAPSYAALWAQLIVDGDKLEAQYEKQYGEKLVYTYQDHLQNTPGVMELPENNAGVELFWRFSQMTIVPLADGDAVVEAVHDSVNGPTLGLCSASKLDNSKQAQGENGMDIAWVTGLEPYTAQDAAAYSYVVSGCDNPAGARLFIRFMMGDTDGVSGCYQTFDKLGHWSVRDDVTYEKSGITYEEVNLTAPNFAEIYANYPNVKAYWSLWNSTR